MSTQPRTRPPRTSWFCFGVWCVRTRPPTGSPTWVTSPRLQASRKWRDWCHWRWKWATTSSVQFVSMWWVRSCWSRCPVIMCSIRAACCRGCRRRTRARHVGTSCRLTTRTMRSSRSTSAMRRNGRQEWNASTTPCMVDITAMGVDKAFESLLNFTQKTSGFYSIISSFLLIPPCGRPRLQLNILYIFLLFGKLSIL